MSPPSNPWIIGPIYSGYVSLSSQSREYKICFFLTGHLWYFHGFYFQRNRCRAFFNSGRGFMIKLTNVLPRERKLLLSLSKSSSKLSGKIVKSQKRKLRTFPSQKVKKSNFQSSISRLLDVLEQFWAHFRMLYIRQFVLSFHHTKFQPDPTTFATSIIILSKLNFYLCCAGHPRSEGD